MNAAPAQMTDSPWFWAYLFTTFGLIALAVISPKFSARQAQLERQYQGRQRATQNVRGAEPTGDLSGEGHTLVTLQPLFFVLAAVTTIAWLVFWRTQKSKPTTDN